MNLTSAIYAKLAGDPILTAMLATFEGAPAIFTNWPVPPNAARPYVLSAGDTSVAPFDELSATMGTDVLRDVAAIFDNTGSALAAEAAQRQIRAALHQQPLSIPGGLHLMTVAINAGVFPTDTTLIGRFVTFRIVSLEA